MKIAHLTAADMSLRYLLLNQLISIQNEGYQVIGISSDGPDVPFLTSGGIRHIPVKITRKLSPLHDILTVWRLYRIFRKEKFTVLHTHFAKPSLLGVLAARLAGVPVIVNTLHGYYFHEQMRRSWRRFYIAMETISAWGSDVILSQNKEDLSTADREHICSLKKMKYLGNGIDLQRFNRSCVNAEMIHRKKQELKIQNNEFVVGFVGRLVAEKGILELLQAAQQIIKTIPHVRFLIIGPIEPEKPDAVMPEVAQQFGLTDACIFTGMRQDMPELFSLMDVFVLPSHREGFPRSPMEASAMGVPCVVTDIRGCREVVEDGRNGLIVPLNNPKQLACAILDLLIDRNKAFRMGEAGIEIARDRFDEQKVIEQVKKEYQMLLQEKRIIK